MISNDIKTRASPLSPIDNQFKGNGALSDKKSNLSNPENKNSYVTVFTDPINFNIKHPLQSSWTLWYDSSSKKPNSKDWSSNLKSLITLSTVEDFWGVYNNIIKSSELSFGSNFHFFKEGIRPEWEDTANENGGRWTCQMSRQQNLPVIDDLWLYSNLYCIGETSSASDEICGVVVSARKMFFRLSLWTRSANDPTLLKMIGEQFRQAIDLNIKEQLEFQPHNEGQKYNNEKMEKLVL